MKKTLTAAALVLLACFLPVILIPSLRYYYWGDETRQVIPLTISLYNDLHAGTFGTWSFGLSFGASNAIHFLSYLGSPSFWLLYLLPKAEMIPSALPFVTLLSMFAGAVFSYLWLADLTEDWTARFAGTMIMTFSGWVIFWQHYYSYVDAWMYICLLLFAMEEVLQGRKRLLFPAVIALITVLDLFTMYMASWLILFYMTTRLAMKGRKPLEIVRELIHPFLLYLLGLGMAGAVFLMDAKLLLASSRVNTGVMSYLTNPSNLFLNPREIYRAVTALFSPVINDYDYNIFSSPFLDGKGIHAYALVSYSFILYPLLFPQVLRVNFSGKKPLLCMLGILILCAFVPDAYVLFNGNTAARWSFYLIVFHVLLLSQLISHRKEWDETLLKRSAAAVILLLSGFSACTLVLHLTTETNRLSILILVPLLAGLCFLYAFSLRRHLPKLFCAALLAEGCLCMYARFVNGRTVTIGKGERALVYERMLYDTHIIDRIKSEDPGFYRITSDEPTAENYLLPSAKGYYSSSSYFSIYNTPSEGYYERRITDTWFIPSLPSKFLSYGVFGNKYLLTFQGEQSFVPYGYEKRFEDTAADGTPVTVYQNAVDTGLGFASAVTFSAPRAEEIDRSLQDYLFMRGIFTESSEGEPVSDDIFVYLGDVNNAVLEYRFDAPGTLFIDYSMSEPAGCGSYELYRNGEAAVYREFDEYGFHAIRIEEPYDAVGVYARNKNFTAGMIDAKLYWIRDEDLAEAYRGLSALDSIETISEEGGRIRAKIRIRNGTKTVATSIPYNEGWRVCADGAPVSVTTVNTSFLGFELEEGEHELLFVFTPAGWNAGKWVSLGSLLVYAAFLIRHFCLRKQRSRNRSMI